MTMFTRVVARRRYSVAIAFQDQESDVAIEQGLPLKYVLPTDAPAQRTAGYGCWPWSNRLRIRRPQRCW